MNFLKNNLRISFYVCCVSFVLINNTALSMDELTECDDLAEFSENRYQQIADNKDRMQVDFEDIWHKKKQNYCRTQETFVFKPLSQQERSKYSIDRISNQYLDVLSVQRAYQIINGEVKDVVFKELDKEHKKVIRSLAAKGNLRAALLSGQWPEKDGLQTLETMIKKNSTDLVSKVCKKNDCSDSTHNHEKFLSILQHANALTVFANNGSSKNSVVPYTLAYLYLCRTINVENSNVAEDIEKAIEYFKKVIAFKSLSKADIDIITVYIVDLYEALAKNTQDIKKKKEYFSQMSLYNPQKGLFEKSLLVLTQSPTNSSAEEINEAHTFFLSKKNDKEFRMRFLDTYLKLGILYSKGSQDLSIVKNTEFAEAYLRIVLSVPLNNNNRITNLEASYNLAQMLLAKAIALAGTGNLDSQLLAVSENLFIRCRAYGDMRGIFGLGITEYWKNNFPQALIYLQTFWSQAKENLYPEECLICAWYIGTLLLIYDINPSFETCCKFFDEAKLFLLPHESTKYFSALFQSTSPHIKMQLKAYADKLCQKIVDNPEWSQNPDEEHTYGISALYVIGRLFLNEADYIKKSVEYLSKAAHEGNRYALLYLGTVPEEIEKLLPNSRAMYLRAIEKITEDDQLWRIAQAQLISDATHGCFDAQVVVAHNVFEFGKLVDWLNELITSTLKAPLLFQTTIVHKSNAFNITQNTKLWDMLKELCHKDNCGAQFLLGNIFISCHDYETGLPLLEKVEKKFAQTNSPFNDEFRQYMALLRIHWAISLLESGQLEKDAVVKEKSFVYAITELYKSMQSGSALAQIGTGLFLSANLVKEQEVNKLLGHKGELKLIEIMTLAENFFKAGLEKWDSLLVIEKNMFKELFGFLLAPLQHNKKQSLINTCSQRLTLLSLREQNSDVKVIKKQKVKKRTIASIQKEKRKEQVELANGVSAQTEEFSQANLLIKLGKLKEGFAILENLARNFSLDACFALILAFLEGNYIESAEHISGYYLFASGYVREGIFDSGFSLNFYSSELNKVRKKIKDYATGKIKNTQKTERARGLIETIKKVSPLENFEE